MPVYIFTKSQQLWGENITYGLYGVILYYFIWVCAKIVLLIPSANLIAKLGYRWTITISNIFWMLLLVLFFLSGTNVLYLLFAPFVHAIATCLYWLAYHSLFAEDGHLSHIGKEVGSTHLFGTLISTLGPLAGGLIIEYSGFSSLFLLSLLIMAMSSFPFFFTTTPQAQNSCFNPGHNKLVWRT